MTPRRTANWLTTYRDFVLPLVDAPESYVFWSGIFALSCALRRRVWLPKSYLGKWTCYPHMYLMFVGPPGMRKTTAIDHGARELLQQVDAIQAGPDFFTKEAVLEEMNRSADNSIYMTVDEFSNVMQKAGKDQNAVYEFFTGMYDSKTSLVSATKTQGTVALMKPCLNFFSATTPGWISDRMPEGVITGGFASRCIWVYEEKLRINKMFFDDVEGDFQKMETDLLLDLIHISTQLEGPFVISPELREYLRFWETQEPPEELVMNDKLSGYLNRRKMHVAKLAMLHSVSVKDELVLTLEDWHWAENALQTFEPNLHKVFGGVGKNKYNTEIEKIVAYVRNANFFYARTVPEKMIYEQFQSAVEPQAMKGILEYIAKAEKLNFDQEEGKLVFWHPSWKGIA